MPLARYQPGPTTATTSSSSSRTTPSRSASAKRKNSAQGDGHELQASSGVPFAVEEFGPPEWRPVLSSKADLGYPDFYPSRPGFHQLEDVLTEENVKLGFQPKASIAVSSEGFSMHGMIHSQLTGDALGKLDALAHELLAKRDESMPTLGPRTYRLPPRVTYNDIKRLAYIADLANPTVPLYKLARQSVPHGYKGIELLETMWSPAPPVNNQQAQAASSSTPAVPAPTGPVPVDRAAWFVRVLGANEVVVLRNRPANANALAASWTGKPLTPSQQYTVEFTSIYTAFLRKQLMDLVLPQSVSASKLIPGSQGGSNAVAGKQAVGVRNAGVLGDTTARARWVAKWDYSLELLRTLHDRYLISSRGLSTWLADFAATCNLAQIGFIAQLVEEYMTDVQKHVSLARLILRAVLDKLAEIRKSASQDHLTAIIASCTRITQAFFSANPDILLSPTTWSRHSASLQEIILSQVALAPLSNTAFPGKLALDQESPASTSTVAISGILGDSGSTHIRRRQRRLLADFTEIQGRNERLLSRSTAASPNSMSPRRQAMADIQKLDSLSASTQINDFVAQYFDGPASPTSGSLDYAKLEEKVHILLVWALSVYTLGDHRPYAVCTLLKKWQDAYVSHRPPDTEMDIDLFEPLFSWLDTSEAAQKAENIPAIALSFGELTREGIFSYGRYLQLLIAKGYTSRAASQGGVRSHHLDLLEAMPIFVQDKGMLLQRRIVLYGLNTPLDREKLKTEAQTQARLRDEIARIVPEIYGGSVDASLSTDWNPSELARTSSRYELVQARFWIFPLSVAFIDRLSPSSFVRMLNFFESCRGYATVLDFILRALKAPVHNAILNITLDTVRRGAEVWTAMDRQGQLATALLEKFTRLRNQGHFNSALWKQLKHFTQQGYLPIQAVPGRRMSLQYAIEFATALPKVNSLPSMTEICKAATAEEIEAAIPAYQSSGDRSGRLTAEQWKEILQVFVPGAQVDPRHICAFLAGMESASGTETTGVILEWLEQQTPSSRLRLFSPSSLHPTLRLLVQLVAVGCLQTNTLLSSLIFPLWTALAEGPPNDSGDLNKIIAATTSMASQLLLVSRSPTVKLPFFDIMEVKTLETSRADAFRDPDAVRLVRHLPLLVVLENEVELQDETRDAVSALRLSLSLVASFRTAAFRHLDLLKDVFLAPVWAKHRIPALDARMIDALKAIMTDGGPSKPRSEQALPPWSRNTARYSAWRWTRTVLELRLSFKQLAVRIMQGEEVETSRKALRELAQSMFSNDVNNDETDLICEAFRGVESVAVEQVVIAGIDHLTSLVNTLGLDTNENASADPEAAARSIENVVRMLQSIIEVHTQSEDLSIDASGMAVRERLTVSVATLLRSLASSLRPGPEAVEAQVAYLDPTLSRPLRPLLTRLRALVGVVKFYLILPTVLTSPSSQKARQSLAEAATTTLDIIWHLPSYGPETGPMAELLADVHCYMVDELPREAKPAMQAALNKIQATNGNPDKAASAVYLRHILPYETPPRRAMILVDTAAGDSSWQYEDRPWETSEQLEPSERSNKHGDSFLDPTLLANNSSIPLSAFDAKLWRDKVPVSEPSRPWTAYASERNLGNGLAGEPPSAARQATTLYNGDYQLATIAAAAVSDGLFSATSPSVASTYTREQPERKAQSQSNGAKSSGQSTNDPIEIDDDDEDDDDIEVIPPPAKRPRSSISKSSTGSKTVARKVPQKAAKAPASSRGKGRRRSQVD